MPKVTIYSLPTCGYCKMAKQYLNSLNIPYEDIDVSKNHEAAHEMIRKSGQTGTPVIEINDRIIVGFQREAIDQALALA